MKRTLAALLIAAGLLGACNAQQPPVGTAVAAVAAPAARETISAAKLTEVQTVLETRFKGAPIKGLRASVFPGLFEAMVGDDVIYFDDKLGHFIVGNLIEAATMSNKTEERTSELTAIDVKLLPLNDSIKFVRGKGERVMYVFTDADCPFCVRLEQTIQQMDNVTVYNFLNPIDSLHPDAGRKSKVIWCSADKQKSWLDFMLNGKLIANVKPDCANPVEATKALGAKLGVRATPSFFLADGRMIAGAIPKEQLEVRLNAAQAKVAALK